MHRKLVKIENNTNNCNLEINIRKNNRNRHNIIQKWTQGPISFALEFPVKFQNISRNNYRQKLFFFLLFGGLCGLLKTKDSISILRKLNLYWIDVGLRINRFIFIKLTTQPGWQCIIPHWAVFTQIYNFFLSILISFFLHKYREK